MQKASVLFKRQQMIRHIAGWAILEMGELDLCFLLWGLVPVSLLSLSNFFKSSLKRLKFILGKKKKSKVRSFQWMMLHFLADSLILKSEIFVSYR